jgi:hypothetical protein
VDSIHLGITTVSNSIVLNNSVATLAAAMPTQTSLAVSPRVSVIKLVLLWVDFDRIQLVDH